MIRVDCWYTVFVVVDEVTPAEEVTVRDTVNAAGSTLTTVGKVDRLGGKLAFCSAEMTDETGKVIVRAHCVMCFTGRALPL